MLQSGQHRFRHGARLRVVVHVHVEPVDVVEVGIGEQFFQRAAAHVRVDAARDEGGEIGIARQLRHVGHRWQRLHGRRSGLDRCNSNGWRGINGRCCVLWQDCRHGGGRLRRRLRTRRRLGLAARPAAQEAAFLRHRLLAHPCWRPRRGFGW
jgi:hypothetical protein